MIPELVAAVPRYLGQSFAEAAPGHRFQIYFNHWEAGKFTAYKDARLPDIKHLDKHEKDAIRKEFEKRKNRAVGDTCPLPHASKAQIQALRNRQQALHAHHGPNGYRISTTSTAPFATGLGNEHPIENGFAFLTPYGLPYLAGSGVKGILRRAMQELCNDRVEGFSDEAINALFGPETVNKPEDARRGALDFWDVFPSPAGDKLVVEIMTPHFGKYYQGSETPHDAGQPVPVSFLAVPAGSAFDFHVVCQPSRLHESLQNQWRGLLDQAFAHAFEWVGFGAKTSVGYGAMNVATAQPVAVAAPKTQAAATAHKLEQVWASATLTLNPGTGEIQASFEGKVAKGMKSEADLLRAGLPEDQASKLKKKHTLKGVAVRVAPLGNGWRLNGLASP